MRGLNLDHVRAFTEVARLGTFSAAAEQLNLTQPAISQQIAQLENGLGWHWSSGWAVAPRRQQPASNCSIMRRASTVR